MGMGFNFIVSPDQIEEPPQSARSCVENSMVPETESADSPSSNFAQGGPSCSVAAKLGMVLTGLYYLFG